jgi:hypothetical protein
MVQFLYVAMDGTENSKRAGKFTVPPGKNIDGELTLSGANTSLYLHDKDEFSTLAIQDQYIKGVLNDLTKVSLIRCITTSGPGSGGREGESYHFATVFPHFVVLGNSYLAPNDETITEAQFVIDDASTLFYDFDAFGAVIDARPFIDQITNANESIVHRKVETGPDPQILYFTGKREIFSVDTVLGGISASHSPSRNLGGPEGIWLKNTIAVSITFRDPVTFDHCTEHISTLLPYLGLLVGRPQNLLRLTLRTQGIQETPTFLEVYWCMRPKRDPEHEGQKPHPAEVLLDAVRKPQEFSRVLAHWLSRHDAWRDARSRFFNSFARQIHYDIDRLVGSANMFDILPDTAVPPVVEVSDELKAAKESSQKMFRALPRTPERDSVLNALGRIGKSVLKQKIRHRALLLVNATGGRFNEITTVTDEGVNCRNHYVHGSDPSFDYNTHFDMVEFFTDALEFVFAASDLIEGGWDLKAWSDKGSSMSHPFGRFLVGYGARLQELKALLTRAGP